MSHSAFGLKSTMASSNNPSNPFRKVNSTDDEDKSGKNREERPRKSTNPFQEESNKYKNPFGSSDGYEDFNEGLLPFEEHPSVRRHLRRPHEPPPPPPRSSSLVQTENEKNRQISKKYIMSYQPPKEGKKDWIKNNSCWCQQQLVFYLFKEGWVIFLPLPDN